MRQLDRMSAATAAVGSQPAKPRGAGRGQAQGRQRAALSPCRAALFGSTLLLGTFAATELPARESARASAPLASLGTTVGSAARPARASGAAAAELATGACRLARWAAAVDLMRVVSRSERSADAWLCLARAQRHTGEWVAALDSYDELADNADPSARARSARQLGAAERQELEAQLAWIQIEPSVPLPDDAQLTLDGDVLAPSLLGVAFPVAPGTHELALEVEGGVQKFVRLRFEQGERRRVPFALPGDGKAEDVAVAQRSRRTMPSTSAVWSRWALVAGSVATGGGLGVMLLSGASGPASKEVFVAGTGTVLFGGLSLIAGALLRAGSRTEAVAVEARSRPQRLQLEPWLGKNVAGVSGKF